MIPEVAVEAAALAFIATRSADNYVSPAEYAAAMLEAAAPHMLDEEGAVEFDRPAGYMLPEPIVLPDLSDDKVWADLEKKAEQCERESRRTRRKYWLHQIFPWL